MYKEKTIYQVIKSIAIKNKDIIAYDFLDYTCNYENFLQDIDRCAYYLVKLGIKKEDIISIYLPNIPRALILYYAINKIGAISNFIHPNMPINENEEILGKMKPKIIFILDSMYKNLQKLKEKNLCSKYLIVKVSEFLPYKYKMIYKVKEMLFKYRIKFDTNTIYYFDRNLRSTQIEVNNEIDKVSTILFTGGTTGQVKGVCLSSKNMNVAAMQTSSYKIESNETNKMLAILPIFHGYGLVNCIHTTLLEGGTLILLPYFKEKQFKRVITYKKPNYILAIPKLYYKMNELLMNENIDLSFLRGLYCGGASLSEKLLIKVNGLLREKNSKTVLREGYGLTECVGACTLMPLQKFKKGSIGIPYNGVKIIIKDINTKKNIKNYEIGEICVISESIMLGYFGEITTNIQYENNEKILYTGDVGYIDDEGYVFFVDRIKRMIKISGYEVYPEKVEACISEISNIINCCVVEKKKNSISYLKVYVVLDKKFKQKQTYNQIIKKCKNNLSRWSTPREIEFVKIIPTTLLKKNNYRKLSNH